MEVITIPRSRWLRGESMYHSSLLRRRDRKQCCLGIISSARGVPDEALEDVPSLPSIYDLPFRPRYEPVRDILMVNSYTPIMWLMMELNDDKTIPERAREVVLADLAAAYFNIQLNFID